MRLEFSYDTYHYVSLITPLAALLLSLVGMLVSIYTTVLLCFPCRRRMKQLTQREIPHEILVQVEETGSKLPCWTLIFGGLKMVYGHQVDEIETRGKSTVYMICGRHVKSWLLVVLFMVVVFVCSCVVVAFWNEFLVEESYSCQSDVDCFVLDENDAPLHQEPLVRENCTEFELSKDSNVTLRCFKFVFNYASALGNAGGVLVLASAVMNVQAGLWIGASACQGKLGRSVAIAAVATLNMIIEVAMFTLPFAVFYIPLLQETVTKTSRSQVQFFTYWITFLCAFTFSGPVLILFSKQPSATIDDSEQNSTGSSTKLSLSGTAESGKNNYKMRRPFSVGGGETDSEVKHINRAPDNSRRLYPSYDGTQ